MKEVYKIESKYIAEMEKYFDKDKFSAAGELFKTAERIDTCDCGYFGIIYQQSIFLKNVIYLMLIINVK